MTELVLTRASDDRRRSELAGYGSIRRSRRLGYDCELVTTDGRALRAVSSGFWRARFAAVDARGATVGGFTRHGLLTRSGDLTWDGASLPLTASGWWQGRYTLTRDRAVVLVVEPRAWGAASASVTITDPGADAGLVLFTVWLAVTFARQQAAAAAS